MAEESKPGRELDAEVATRVFGWTECDPAATWPKWEFGDPGDDWTCVEEPWCRGLGCPPGQKHAFPYPRYSETIEAAWEVVDHLKGLGNGVEAWITNRFAEIELRYLVKVRGMTFPHAVCLAALAAAEPPKHIAVQDKTVALVPGETWGTAKQVEIEPLAVEIHYDRHGGSNEETIRQNALDARRYQAIKRLLKEGHWSDPLTLMLFIDDIDAAMDKVILRLEEQDAELTKEGK